MRAPLISVLVVFMLVFPTPSTAFSSFVPDHLQILPLLPAEFRSFPSLPGGEKCAPPPPDDERSFLHAPFLLPNCIHTLEIASLPAQPWVQQNKKVIGVHHTNVWASTNLLLFVIFSLIMFYCWTLWRKHVISKKKKARKYRKKKACKYREKKASDSVMSTLVGKSVRHLLQMMKGVLFMLHFCRLIVFILLKLHLYLPEWKSDNLFVSGKIIGTGCNGTVVFEGTFNNRPVAVKRILVTFYNIASKEINHLTECNQHPNIVEFYGMKQSRDFVYVVLERCNCSLDEFIMSPADSTVQLQVTSGVLGRPSPALLKVMRDIVVGLAHLHNLGIIHRDLKPKNILILEENGYISAKISDMGISKRLPADISSITNATGCGSPGWRPREQLKEERQSRAVDLFSFGCLLFFCITSGRHPFGVRLERDTNILKDKKNLLLVAHMPEAFDLISSLLDPSPKSRPTAAEVLAHPLFWGPEKRLEFLGHACDFLESKITPKLRKSLKDVNKKGKSPPAFEWGAQLDETFLSHMKRVGRKQNYDGKSIRNLLCIIRNASHSYTNLPEQVKARLGPHPEGFESYFRIKFPKLLMEIYKVLKVDCGQEDFLKGYYK